MARERIVLACVECQSRNYTVTKNRSLKPDRVSYRKYCASCGQHTTHKETR